MKTSINQFDHLISPYGENLIDLYIDQAEVVIGINNPGIEVGGLDFVNNLSLIDGYTFDSLSEFAGQLDLISHCGHSGNKKEALKVMLGRLKAKLHFPIGEIGMYQNELRLSTQTGESLKSLIDRTIYNGKRNVRPIVCLVAKEGSGEHNHGQHQQPNHGHHHHHH